MITQTEEWGEVLTLPNGSGSVTFFAGEWDESLRGDIWCQYADVSQNTLNRMIEAYEEEGYDAAWKVYHDSLPQFVPPQCTAEEVGDE